ncbi:unnamed protein product [Cladocopium goreaui]|uniref:Methyltransferase-like protein 24 n=1 Tax=Cladocopium goreaui TaxID=2562237 RepID=A0A9P1CYG6_9DINO|nr:unnamed protein product [Cladocopium goreaui]
MDEQQQKEFISEHMDSDLQFVLSDNGVSLGAQVAVARRYGTLRKFRALGDSRAEIRQACLQDFAIPQDNPADRAETAAIVSSWEVAQEFIAKETEIRAEAKVLGQPRTLQVHERQAMVKAVEAVYGVLQESETPSVEYLSVKAEETETNEPVAASLDEVSSRKDSTTSQMQTGLDSTGHIRITKTKVKSKLPSNTEEYRRAMRVEMYAWLCMAARYKAKAWLHGLTAAPFNRFVDFILGEKVYNIQVPSLVGDGQTRVKPDWGIILNFEHRLRKEAFKLVVRDGATLADALNQVIHDAELKETYFTTPVALRAAMSAQADPPQQKWQRKLEAEGRIELQLHEIDIERSQEHDLRKQELWDNVHELLRFQWKKYPGPRPLRNRTWPKGFPWLSNENGKIVAEANEFIFRCLDACTIAVQFEGWYFWEHPEDLGLVQDEVPGSIWQWTEVHELLAMSAGITFAIHQCHFGALTPKPTRLMCNVKISDKRCFFGMPKFDSRFKYLGPLPVACGHTHVHKLMGKTANRWNTSPSASYPDGLCKFIVEIILVAHATSGRGCKDAPNLNASQVPNLNGLPAGSRDPSSQVSTGPKDVQRGNLNGLPAGSKDPSPQVSTGQRDVQRCAQEVVQVDSGSEAEAPDTTTAEDRGGESTAFRLATGKLVESPFSRETLENLRKQWAGLLPDPVSALVVAEGQPFLLHGLAQWLEIFEDPDVDSLVNVEDSFSTGVPVGVLEPLPRTPQVFPPKLKHKKLDESEFNPLAVNYPSARVSVADLEKKFLEEEALGRMFPIRLPVAQEKFGADKVRVAAMAAITKPDGSVRPLHDGTHSVQVNNAIVYKDQIQCPGPPEVAAAVREALESREAPFAISADIKAAHRLVKIRPSDWGFLACRADSDSQTVWINKCGTFGISSAPYWWAKLFSLVGRFVGHLMSTTWFLHMVYVDDLHGAFTGLRKFHNMWVWILAFELIGTPFGYHKFRGGFSVEFVGFQMKYDTKEVGVTIRRGDWLRDWILAAADKRYVVVTRDFAEFLGRLGFVSQLLVWMKPHLSPLYAWSAATGSSTVAKLPDTVILTLKYILAELQMEQRVPLLEAHDDKVAINAGEPPALFTLGTGAFVSQVALAPKRAQHSG